MMTMTRYAPWLVVDGSGRVKVQQARERHSRPQGMGGGTALLIVMEDGVWACICMYLVIGLYQF